MQESFNILVVEDDLDINGLLCNILKRNGYNVVAAYSGTEAKMCMEYYAYDLVLLDLMLPGIDGESIIDRVRQDKFMPIIVISAKTDSEEKINALKLGADDYITKPFNINEVLARVEVQLRRYNKFSLNHENDKLCYKNIRLNKDSRQVFINNEEAFLTLREFSILELLMSNKNKVFTRENLFESIWENEFIGDYNTVNVHVSNLRSKLAKLDKEEYIQTVWGIGFKLKD